MGCELTSIGAYAGLVHGCPVVPGVLLPVFEAVFLALYAHRCEIDLSCPDIHIGESQALVGFGYKKTPDLRFAEVANFQFSRNRISVFVCKIHRIVEIYGIIAYLFRTEFASQHPDCTQVGFLLAHFDDYPVVDIIYRGRTHLFFHREIPLDRSFSPYGPDKILINRKFHLHRLGQVVPALQILRTTYVGSVE